ncbi:hypothetical protein [Pseudomonas aeruginosa]|uniref:hypothetical protein n=1 Tax=Pseudomonas aeruginosa TaxID=287 RepID=UPI003988E796
MQAIQCGGWIGHTGLGLAPRELEATAWSASELTAKEVARRRLTEARTIREITINA